MEFLWWRKTINFKTFLLLLQTRRGLLGKIQLLGEGFFTEFGKKSTNPPFFHVRVQLSHWIMTHWM